MSDKGHISTLIANREAELYGLLRDNLLSFEKFLVDSISDICRNMMYDFRDVYLIVVFDVSFEDSDGPQPVACKYCTTKEVEGCKDDTYHEVVPTDYTVSKETIEYFDARVASVETIAGDFAAKKLGAYKFKFFVDYIAKSYKITATYILGSQKNKPTA